MDWKVGDRLTHRFNRELGTGRVRAIDGRTLVIEFPGAGELLRVAAASDAIAPLVWRAGMRARELDGGATVTVTGCPAPGRVALEDGRELDESALWPLEPGSSPGERLARGDVERVERFALRLEAMRLAAIREADGLGSFLGGRIRLFPHQLHAAERATRTDPVRWLLADEVGLGKTVEACLILDHLLRRGRATRSLVIAPDTLTVQWLGELWRKYHQVFVLLDDKRLADVERDFGEGFNPFETYHASVVGLEFLLERPRLVEQAVEAGIDLVIVDEAHRLRRPAGHPGNPAYRAVAPLAGQGRHLLLLTATPLDEDAHGFCRLVQLLRPDEFPDGEPVTARLERGEPLPPCTSATRRVDIGGLPPREPRFVELADDASWAAQRAVETAVRAAEPANAAQRAAALRRVRRALASGTSLEAILPADDPLAPLARAAAGTDPRVEWLAEQAPRWRADGDRTLVFVADRATLDGLRDELSRRVQLRTGIFHDELSPGQRDIEVAQFRTESGPSMLISTECGGEGRNFEFCTRLVLFDLPWHPMTLEQRIGRLDRIGREGPVRIVAFQPPDGLGRTIVELYRSLGLFERPLGSIERELAGVEDAIGELALSGEHTPDADTLRDTIEEARRALDRVQRAAHHQLHREPYRADLGPSILERVPDGLGALTEEVIVGIAELLRLGVESHRDGTRHSFELGTGAAVESLPGVPAGSSFLGSFRREEAVRDESIDYFAAGHPLVEGLLAQVDDAPWGRVAMLHRSRAGAEAFGLLAVYRERHGFRAVAVDIEGRERPDLAELLLDGSLHGRKVDPKTWAAMPGWATLIRSLVKALDRHGPPDALAAFRLQA